MSLGDCVCGVSGLGLFTVRVLVALGVGVCLFLFLFVVGVVYVVEAVVAAVPDVPSVPAVAVVVVINCICHFRGMFVLLADRVDGGTVLWRVLTGLRGGAWVVRVCTAERLRQRPAHRSVRCRNRRSGCRDAASYRRFGPAAASEVLSHRAIQAAAVLLSGAFATITGKGKGLGP